MGRALGQAGVTLTPWVATETLGSAVQLARHWVGGMGPQGGGWGWPAVGARKRWCPPSQCQLWGWHETGQLISPLGLALYWRSSKRCLGLAP